MAITSRIKEISRDRETFFSYVNKTIFTYRRDQAYFNYLRLMNLRRRFCLKELFDRKDFLRLVYDTLVTWNMNARAAQLVDFDNFVETIKNSSEIIIELEKFSLEQIKDVNEFDYILDKIRILFDKMTVMKSNSQIVGLSKTLHFLLPNLVMPIDGKFTLNFFYGHRKYRRYRSEEFEMFKEIFYEFYKIAKSLKLNKNDTSENSWNQSVPKIIDNAIIAFTKSHILSAKKDEEKIHKVTKYLPSNSIKTDKEGEENEYYIYENWVAEKKAVIHKDDCGHCNCGQGKNTNIHGEMNGKWHGPFENYDKAKKYASKLIDRKVKDCKVCNPR